MMDVALACALWKLDPSSLAAIWLRRLVPSKYEIDGRRVTISWKDYDRGELFVCEDNVYGGELVPLLDYLRQAAGISMSLAPKDSTGDVQRGVVVTECEARATAEAVVWAQPVVISEAGNYDNTAEEKLDSMERAVLEESVDGSPLKESRSWSAIGGIRRFNRPE